MRLLDSGFEHYDLRGSVEHCDDCDESTVHLQASGGVPICGECGYSPETEALADADTESTGAVSSFFGWFR